MIQGFIAQASYYKPAYGDNDPRVAQVIIIPTAGQLWRREVSTDHPRRMWRVDRHATVTEPFPSYTAAGRSLLRTWGDEDTSWHLTGDPIGFQITDEEYLDMVSGANLPRNVALRAQRALDATNQSLLGAGAGSRRPKDLYGAIPTRLTMYGKGSPAEALAEYVGEMDGSIEAMTLGAVLAVTPSAARARGAGPLRNRSSLPVRSEGGSVAPAPSVTIPTLAPVVVAAPPKVKDGSVKPGDHIIAADGVPYVAREVQAGIKGLSDVQLFRDAYAADMNVLLLGEPGTGKTRGLLGAFPNAIVVPVTGDTEVSDLVGTYVPTGPDTFIWVDGPLIKAMEEGRMLVMDEIGMADSKVLALLYGLMDKKGTARKLLVTANPARGTVTAAEGFGIAGTSNPNAKGVHLAEPLLSRFAITMTVTTDYAVARTLGANERLTQAAEHMAKQREAQEIGWAPEMRNLLDARDIEAKFGIVMALRALIMQAPELEREVVEIILRERFGDLPQAAKLVKALGV